MPYGLGIPVVGEFDLRRVVAGRGEEDEREAAALVVDAAQLAQPQQVAIEVQRLARGRPTRTMVCRYFMVSR